MVTFYPYFISCDAASTMDQVIGKYVTFVQIHGVGLARGLSKEFMLRYSSKILRR